MHPVHSSIMLFFRLLMLALLCLSTAVPPAMLLQVGCAKRHTVVLTSDGEPLTWGHRIVTPRRVQVRSAHMAVRRPYAVQGFPVLLQWRRCHLSPVQR